MDNVINIKEKQIKHTGNLLDIVNGYLGQVKPQAFVEISYDLGITLIAQALMNYNEDTRIDMLNELAGQVQECVEFMEGIEE